MPDDIEKVKITTVILQIDGQRIICDPCKPFMVDPNSEPWPNHWSIVYNVYDGNDLIIEG